MTLTIELLCDRTGRERAKNERLHFKNVYLITEGTTVTAWQRHHGAGGPDRPVARLYEAKTAFHEHCIHLSGMHRHGDSSRTYSVQQWLVFSNRPEEPSLANAPEQGYRGINR